MPLRLLAAEAHGCLVSSEYLPVLTDLLEGSEGLALYPQEVQCVSEASILHCWSAKARIQCQHYFTRFLAHTNAKERALFCKAPSPNTLQFSYGCQQRMRRAMIKFVEQRKAQ